MTTDKPLPDPGIPEDIGALDSAHANSVPAAGGAENAAPAAAHRAPHLRHGPDNANVATDGAPAEPPEMVVRDQDAHPRHAERFSWTRVDTTTPQPSGRGALVMAERLSLATPQGQVFGPVDWTIPQGGHGVVLGEQGSGRSALLLALAGRMKGVIGRLTVAGVDAIASPRAVRHRTAVARITDLVELEPNLTVAEARDERALSEGLRPKKGRLAFATLEDALGHRFEPGRAIGELPGDERTLLTAVLACLRPADLVVYDDIDEALTEDQLGLMYHHLATLGDLGHHFVVSALDREFVPAGVSVLRLPPPVNSGALALSFAHIRNRRLASRHQAAPPADVPDTAEHPDHQES